MRQIKYRVWLPWLKRMAVVSNLEMSWQSGEISNICYILPEHDVEYEVLPENVELMQYVGEDDQEGNEVYEGDILESGGCRGIVEFIEGTFELERREDRVPYNEDVYVPYIDWPAEFFYNCKVIGNIYENKNLLERKDGSEN